MRAKSVHFEVDMQLRRTDRYNRDMNVEPLPLPPEMSQALAANGGASPLYEDPATRQLYRLVDERIAITLSEDYIRQGLQIAIDEFDRGEFEPWDIEKTIAEAKRQFDQRP